MKCKNVHDTKMWLTSSFLDTGDQVCNKRRLIIDYNKFTQDYIMTMNWPYTTVLISIKKHLARSHVGFLIVRIIIHLLGKEMEVKIDELITMHFWKAFAINKQIYASSGVAKRNISLGSISIVALHPLFKKWLYYLVYLPISMNLDFCLL